jgi:GNAT superfamily N-acetyltransferase
LFFKRLGLTYLSINPRTKDMKLQLRSFRGEDDFWRIRNFLCQVLMINDYRELSWHVARWDYLWARRNDFLPDTPLEELVYLWEAPDGEIAAVLNPEHSGILFQQINPAFRMTDLENEMMEVAEEKLSIPKDGGGQKVYLHADQRDIFRQEILTSRGYSKFDHPKVREHQRHLWLDKAVLEAILPPEYVIRSLRDDEIEDRGLAAWKTNRSGDPPNEYWGWKWLLNVYEAPLYRRDLDIVAVAPNGEIASFCTLWFDDMTQSGYFEPVGTVPEHRQRGLGKAVLCEALRRVKRLGANLAFVSSYTPPAHALYSSIGFTDYDLSEPWLKEL